MELIVARQYNQIDARRQFGLAQAECLADQTLDPVGAVASRIFFRETEIPKRG